jgi:nitroreductase
MKENELLGTIRGRRSVLRFEKAEVTDGQVEAILEAGRWAPSFLNSQPWAFVVVRDPDMKSRVAEILRRVTMGWAAFSEAPAVIMVAVDSNADPTHYIEDGAAAVQNMTLMAHSLGLGSFWAGIRSRKPSRRTVERDLQVLLGAPRSLRLIAAIPIGVPAYPAESTRNPLKGMVHRDRFSGGR